MADLLISPMVFLEFAYLQQRGRVRISAAKFYTNLSTSFRVSLCRQGFPGVAAAELEWTNHPFDRMIVVQSQCAAKSKSVTAIW